MSFDFRPDPTRVIGVCEHCGRQVVPYPGNGFQDVDGFVQCRPRGEPYASAPIIAGRPRGHSLDVGPP